MNGARRTRAPVRAVIVAVLAAVAVAVAGCGGSSGVTPTVYVKSMCKALGTWKSEIQSAGLKLQSSGAGTAQPAVAKQDYQRFVSALLAATQHATDALRSAGTPAVTRGKEIAGGLASAFDHAGRQLSKANSQAVAIPTRNASVFQLGAASVTAQIKTALQGIANVTPRQSPALRTAAGKEPACQVLRG
jgi:hypothetical protein